MKVLKFGGSSVANAESIERVAGIVKGAAAGGPCVVVLSAMQGTTDGLIEMGRAAERGDDGFIAKLGEIAANHAAAVNQLFRNGDSTEVSDFIDSTLQELESITEGVRRVRKEVAV